MKIKIKKLKDEAILPNYAHPGDVGLDLYSLEEKTLQPMERYIFFLGFALEFPNGYGAIVKDKGGPPAKYGLCTFGGVFDAGYRGEYNVFLMNLNTEPVTIKKGQKIAQLVIFPVEIVDLETATELSDSARGEGKLGSTGEFHSK